MSAVKTEVNPSDVGTNALDVNDFAGCELCLDWAMSMRRRVHLETGMMRADSATSCKLTIW